MNDPIAAAKKQLRAELKARRQVLTASGCMADAGAALTRYAVLSRVIENPNACIAGFAATAEEIPTASLLAHLDGAGVALCLPVIVGTAKPLIFRSWRPGDAMGSGQWGIAEPLPDAPVVVPDVVLVPLLGFTRSGYRIGYGGGFYDRTLAQLRAVKTIVAIGVACDEQEVEDVPRDAFDQPVDWMLTPTRLFRCEAN